MGPDQVIAALEAATTMDPIAGLALRVAAVAGARRAELAAPRWRDLRGSFLTVVGSTVTVVRPEGGPVPVDSRTRTAERHTITLDRDTVELWERLRAEHEDFGPYVCNIRRHANRPRPGRLVVAPGEGALRNRQHRQELTAPPRQPTPPARHRTGTAGSDARRPGL